MLPRLVTAPESEPVTLTEAKAHLRIDHALDDTYITALITAARQYAEQIAWRALVTQTWELVLPAFPGCDPIELPMGKLASVVSVEYVDGAGDTQTLSADSYSVDTVSVPGRVFLAYGQSWPTTREQWNAVTIRYVVGEAASSVPQPIKQAILLLIAQMYEHRTPEVTGVSVTPVKFAFDALIAPYRLTRF